MSTITTQAFESVTLDLLFELATRPAPLSWDDRRSLAAAETWLRRNVDGSRRPDSNALEVVAVV